MIVFSKPSYSFCSIIWDTVLVNTVHFGSELCHHVVSQVSLVFYLVLNGIDLPVKSINSIHLIHCVPGCVIVALVKLSELVLSASDCLNDTSKEIDWEISPNSKLWRTRLNCFSLISIRRSNKILQTLWIKKCSLIK